MMEKTQLLLLITVIIFMDSVKSKKTNVCGPGRELTLTVNDKWRCTKCSHGYFSTHHSRNKCKPCRLCKHGVERHCTIKKNTVCILSPRRTCKSLFERHRKKFEKICKKYFEDVYKTCRSQECIHWFRSLGLEQTHSANNGILVQEKTQSAKPSTSASSTLLPVSQDAPTVDVPDSISLHPTDPPTKVAWMKPSTFSWMKTTSPSASLLPIVTLGEHNDIEIPDEDMDKETHFEERARADTGNELNAVSETLRTLNIILVITFVIVFSGVIVLTLVKISKIKKSSYHGSEFGSKHEDAMSGTEVVCIKYKQKNCDSQTITHVAYTEGPSENKDDLYENNQRFSVANLTVPSLHLDQNSDNEMCACKPSWDTSEGCISEVDLDGILGSGQCQSISDLTLNDSIIPVTKKEEAILNFALTSLTDRSSTWPKKKHISRCTSFRSYQAPPCTISHVDTADTDDVHIVEDVLISSLDPSTCTENTLSIERPSYHHSCVSFDDEADMDFDDNKSSQLDMELPNNQIHLDVQQPRANVLQFSNDLLPMSTKRTNPENLAANLFKSQTTQTYHNIENTKSLFGQNWNTCGHFTSEGGKLSKPNSDIVLEIPPRAIPEGQTAYIQGLHSVDFSGLEGHLGQGEVIVSPVAEYQMTYIDRFSKFVKIVLPRVSRNPMETLRVHFYGRNRTGEIEFGDVPKYDTEENQEMYYIMKSGSVEIFTLHFTGFFCGVCGHTFALQLTAMVFGCYPDKDAWVSMHLADKRLEIPDFRQAIIQQERKVYKKELVAEREVDLLEDSDCNSKLEIHFVIRDDQDSWEAKGDRVRLVMRLGKLMKCNCSTRVEGDHITSECQKRHEGHCQHQWVFEAQGEPPPRFSCQIHLTHVLSDNCVTERHGECEEGITNIVVMPIRRDGHTHDTKVLIPGSSGQEMGFPELPSSKRRPRTP